MNFLVVLESRSSKSNYWQGWSPEALAETLFLDSLTMRWRPAALACSYSPRHCLLLRPCLSPLLSLVRVLVIRFRAHWVILDDLITRSLTASTNTLFPNKVTCPGPRGQDGDVSLGRLPFNPLQPPWVARQ